MANGRRRSKLCPRCRSKKVREHGRQDYPAVNWICNQCGHKWKARIPKRPYSYSSVSHRGRMMKL